VPLQERRKELTDKFNAELDADRQKFELLLQEKNEQELEYEEKLKQVSSHVETRQDRPGVCCCQCHHHCCCCHGSITMSCEHAECQGLSPAAAGAVSGCQKGPA
jgi:hypothetical protein